MYANYKPINPTHQELLNTSTLVLSASEIDNWINSGSDHDDLRPKVVVVNYLIPETEQIDLSCKLNNCSVDELSKFTTNYLLISKRPIFPNLQCFVIYVNTVTLTDVQKRQIRQLFNWVLFFPYHDSVDDRCCPNEECCYPNLAPRLTQADRIKILDDYLEAINCPPLFVHPKS